MAPPEAPQLRFLSEAANLLASQSPSTAAHLFSVHTHILHEELKPLNIRQRKHHCGGCGSIRQSKCSQVTQVKPKAKSRVISKMDTTSAGGATVYKCLRCNQRTIHPRKRISKPLSKAPSRVSTSTASPIPTTTRSTPVESSTLQALPSTTTESAPLKKADNANSKKRAKARKQGGLQALLASKKNTQPSLDLFDFLQ
jgi:transposase